MIHSHLLTHILIRWLDLVLLVTLLGGVGYRFFVLKRVPQMSLPSAARPVYPISMGWVLGLLAIVSLVDLILRAAMMSGRSVWETAPAIPIVLSKTHFGTVWIWKMGLILFFAGLRRFGVFGAGPGAMVPYLGLGAGALLALTTSLSGHAADQGTWGTTVFTNGFHVLAVSGWVGGLVWLRIHMNPLIFRLPVGDRAGYLVTAIRSFSKLAITCVAVLIPTGAFNTLVHVHSTQLLITTPYGYVLILKWTFLAPMLVLGAISRFYILPRLEEERGNPRRGLWVRITRFLVETILRRPEARELSELFFRWVTVEAVLGLGVLGCTAWITQLSPPHLPSVGFEHDRHGL